MTDDPIKVTFFAHSLRLGGAEVQLAALARGLDRRNFAPSLVCIHGDGELLQTVRDAGVPVQVVGKRGRFDVVGLFVRIVRALRAQTPDVVYSFLGLPNVIAGMAGPFLRDCRIAWGVRASDMHVSERGLDWRILFALERMLAGRADAIVCNSWSGRDHLAANGFPTKAMVVQPNGIDCERHAPDAMARSRLRAELGVGDEEVVIGMVGRLDPMKDHPNFLRAAADLAAEVRQVRFICVGGGPDDYAAELRRLADELGLASRVIWTGVRTDVAALYNAFDIVTLSSRYGEGFPNVVGEAMACGLPCVVTDVGDAARVVGDTGIVVPIETPRALADGWRAVLAGGPQARAERGVRARQRIESEFPTRAMISGSEAILRALHQRQPLPARAATRQAG